MAALERFEDSVTHYVFGKNEAVPCGEYPKDGLPSSYVTRTKFEYVNSYRGKRKYVQVGEKRRKAFHPFTRFTYSAGEPTIGTVCENWGTYYYHGYVDRFPWQDVMRIHALMDPYELHGTKWSGDLMPIGFKPMYLMGDKLRDHVIRDMYVKLNSPRFNAAVFFGELDETLVGIKDLLQGAVKEVFNRKKGPTYLSYMMRNPHEMWLWYRYALLPAMLEIDALIAVFTEREHELIDRVQSGNRTEKPEIHTGTFKRLNFADGHCDVSIKWTSEVKYGIGGAIDVLSRHDPAEWGTSVQDTLLAAWERVPWSFIIDWFINVGDWLQSLRSVEVVLAQSYATFAIDATTTIDSADPYTLWSTPVYHGFCMDRITDVERPTLPLIDKRWANTRRLIDGVSLIVGMIKSFLQKRRK